MTNIQISHWNVKPRSAALLGTVRSALCKVRCAFLQSAREPDSSPHQAPQGLGYRSGNELVNLVVRACDVFTLRGLLLLCKYLMSRTFYSSLKIVVFLFKEHKVRLTFQVQPSCVFCFFSFCSGVRYKSLGVWSQTHF